MADMHTKDLTTGSPMKLILSFMLPLVFGLLFQQVYSMVDTIVVGQFVGKEALAAVGTTSSIINMLVGFAAGLSTGSSVIISGCGRAGGGRLYRFYYVSGAGTVQRRVRRVCHSRGAEIRTAGF